MTTVIDFDDLVERWTGKVVQVSQTKSGSTQFTILADNNNIEFVKRNRFYGHEQFWDGEVPADLRAGDRVSFLPSDPRKPGQNPRAVLIRRETK